MRYPTQFILTAALLLMPHSICAQSTSQKARMQEIRALYAKAVEKAAGQQKSKKNYITLESKETTPNGEVTTKYVEYIFDVKGNDFQLLMVRKTDKDAENSRYREYLFQNGQMAFVYDRFSPAGLISESRYYLTDGTPFWRLSKTTNPKTKKVTADNSDACNGLNDDMWMFVQAEGENIAEGFQSLVNADLHLFELDTRPKQMTDAQQKARLGEIRKLYANAQELAKQGKTGTKNTYGFADINIYYPNTDIQRHRTAEFILGMELEEAFDVYVPVVKFIRAKEETAYDEFLFENGKLAFTFTTFKNVGNYKSGEYRFYLADDDTNVPFWNITRYFGDDKSKPVSEQAKPFSMDSLPPAIDWYNVVKYGLNLYNAFNSIHIILD